MTLLDAPAARPAGPPATASPRRPGPTLTAPRRWPQWLPGALPACAVLLAAVLRAVNVSGAPTFGDDEGTYTAQAWSVLRHARLAHYTYWYDHPPLGWLQLAAWQALTLPFGHGSAVADARGFAVLASTASAALLYLWARRLGLGAAAASVATALWALSPLAAADGRQVYLDVIGLPWLLAAFALAATPRRGLWPITAAGGCLAVAGLTKETLLVAAPAVAVTAWQHTDRRTRPFCLAGFGCLLVLLLGAYPLFAALKGELFPGPGHVSLLQALQFQFGGRPSTGSALVPGTASHRLLASWVATDPVLLLGGGAAGLLCWCWRGTRSVGVLAVSILVTLVRPGYLPVPFVIMVLPPAALALATVGSRLTGAGRLAELRTAAVTGLALGCALTTAPAWAHRDAALLTTRDNGGHRPAVAWLRAHVGAYQRVLTDDSYYVDLVDAGLRRPLQVVWFYKLDFTANLDPSVARALPGGWRDLSYVVISPALRDSLAATPATALVQVRQAITHAHVVARFGPDGPLQVQIAAITAPRG